MEATVGASKQFGMKYFKKELMTVDFYHGLLIEHGWPQHV